jgi:hypothetical protein
MTTPLVKPSTTTEVFVEVRADSTDVHERPSVLHDTAYPETFSLDAGPSHFTVSFLSPGVMTRPAGTLGIATGEVATPGVVTGVTVGVMVGVTVGVIVLFVPEGDPLELLVLLVPGATLLFTTSARAIGDGMNGSAVVAAMKSARATRSARRSSRLSLLMTDALLLAVVGVGTDLPRIKSFTNSPLVYWMFLVRNTSEKRVSRMCYSKNARAYFSAF